MSNVNLSPVINAVGRVDQQVRILQTHVDQVHASVGSVASDLASTSAELSQLRAEFTNFVQAAERSANVQRSETVLGNLKDDLEREFGHYNIVRRSSVGTLQAFDIGNVSNKTVQEVSEQLMIQTPRYWLAPALVTLAAWSRDDQQLAEKSLDAAFGRDQRKTSLFFALVLQRQGRLDASVRWLRHYLHALDPRALTREFAVVLEASAQGAFGPAGRDLISSQLNAWTEQVRKDPAIVEEQVGKWRAEIETQRGSLLDSSYPALAAVSPQWPQVKDTLERASALQFVDGKFRTLLERPSELTTTVQDRMDDLLEVLVTEYDGEELPLRRKVMYHEAVVESNGDLVRAKEVADAESQALEETLDVLSIQTHAALQPHLLGVSEDTQKVSVGAGKQDFKVALGRYTMEYRQRFLADVDIDLGSNHSGYASSFSFPGWKTSTATPEVEAEADLFRVWDATFRSYIERVSFKYTAVMVPAIVTVGLILLFLITGFFVGALLALLFGGGVTAWNVYQKKAKADKAVAEAEEAREKAKAVSRDLYRSACAEFLDSKLTYEDEDSKEKHLLELIEIWPSIRTLKESI